MRKIAIVGAGQAGMVLAFGLLQEGYEVTVFEGRPAEEIEKGQMFSTAMVFDRQLDVERRYGLHEWEAEAPLCDGMHATLRLPDGRIILQTQGGFDETCQGVDGRVKTSVWMRRFAERGGKLVNQALNRSGLEQISEQYDLVVVSTGRGALSEIFERDEERSLFDAPARKLGAVILKNVKEWAEIPYTPCKFQFFVQIGEFFAIPFYSHSGPARAVVFEATEGSPMDLWGGVDSADKALATALRIIRQFAPEDYPNYQRAELVDDRSWLKGAITPTVRKPVAFLRNGKAVMGLGDAVTVNDPISGSGANDAVRMADRYIRSILDRGGRAFDAEWMQETFDQHYHDHGRHTMKFTKLMTGHMTDPLWKVFQAAAISPGVAHTFVNVYTDIQKTLTWLTDMKAADAICDAYAHEWQGAQLLTVADAMARFMPQQPAVSIQAA